MPELILAGCSSTPLGSYLKALGTLRLISEQSDSAARAWWSGDRFHLESSLDREALLKFFIEAYQPTPIVAPWNGGSGFYPKDNTEGLDAITATAGPRFAAFRTAIAFCKTIDEVQEGKRKNIDQEDQRRTAILRQCRNRLDDRVVEWLDAVMGIDADGGRSFPPILGTGGNEGRLDYTNNFMSRLADLLITPGAKTPIAELLANSLFNDRTTSLQSGAAGQYDPGRAGGANQGSNITSDSITNPWDLILTLEGTVAWASGLYRRQGVGYRRTFLCSPFTVYPNKIGYGSASVQDDARAEIWTPLWPSPVRYSELRALLRESRTSIDGRPARNTLDFAQAASSLGVDRGIDRFVRYSLLKRRGDSFVALPTGTFPVRYRKNSDLVREFQSRIHLLTRGIPKGAQELERGIETAIYQALLYDRQEDIVDLMSSLGRLLKRVATTTENKIPNRVLEAGLWLDACGLDTPEVRIAAALASLYERPYKTDTDAGLITHNLSRSGGNAFAWAGNSLPLRMLSVLNRRLQIAEKNESRRNPLGAAFEIGAGDATLFIEGSIDDDRVEDLLFAFATLDWAKFRPAKSRTAEVLPVYAVLKSLFLPSSIRRGDEPNLIADRRVLTALAAGSIEDASSIAVNRLRIANLSPLNVSYSGGLNPDRLAASLLIPVRQEGILNSGIFSLKKDNQ